MAARGVEDIEYPVPLFVHNTFIEAMGLDPPSRLSNNALEMEISWRFHKISDEIHMISAIMNH